MIKGWFKVEGTYTFDEQTVVVKNAKSISGILVDKQTIDIVIGDLTFELTVILKDGYVYFSAEEVDKRYSIIKGAKDVSIFKRPYDFVKTIYDYLQLNMKVQDKFKLSLDN